MLCQEYEDDQQGQMPSFAPGKEGLLQECKLKTEGFGVGAALQERP